MLCLFYEMSILPRQWTLWAQNIFLIFILSWIIVAQVTQWYTICLPSRRHGFHPWVQKIPWRRKWQATPVFLPGKSHGQRSLVGYSQSGSKESDTTEWQAHTVNGESKAKSASLVCPVSLVAEIRHKPVFWAPHLILFLLYHIGIQSYIVVYLPLEYYTKDHI